MNIPATRGKAAAALLLYVFLNITSCSTTGYTGHSGYHSYKTDTSDKTRMKILLAVFIPLLSVPLVYIINDGYKKNDNLNYVFSLIGLGPFFDGLDKILP